LTYKGNEIFLNPGELNKVKAKVEAGAKLIVSHSDSVIDPLLATTFGISLEALPSP